MGNFHEQLINVCVCRPLLYTVRVATELMQIYSLCPLNGMLLTTGLTYKYLVYLTIKNTFFCVPLKRMQHVWKKGNI